MSASRSALSEEIPLSQPRDMPSEDEDTDTIYEFNRELYRMMDKHFKDIKQLWETMQSMDTRMVIKALKDPEYIEAAADYYRFMKQYNGAVTKKLPYSDQVDIWVHRAHFMKTICWVMSDRDPMIMQWCRETIDGHLEGLEGDKDGSDEITQAFQAAGFQTMFGKIWRNWPKDSREIFPEDIRTDIK